MVQQVKTRLGNTVGKEWKAAQVLRTLSPTWETCVELGPWFHPELALVLTTIWGLKQRMEDLCP